MRAHVISIVFVILFHAISIVIVIVIFIVLHAAIFFHGDLLDNLSNHRLRVHHRKTDEDAEIVSAVSQYASTLEASHCIMVFCQTPAQTVRIMQELVSDVHTLFAKSHLHE